MGSQIVKNETWKNLTRLVHPVPESEQIDDLQHTRSKSQILIQIENKKIRKATQMWKAKISNKENTVAATETGNDLLGSAWGEATSSSTILRQSD